MSKTPLNKPVCINKTFDKGLDARNFVGSLDNSFSKLTEIDIIYSKFGWEFVEQEDSQKNSSIQINLHIRIASSYGP